MRRLASGFALFFATAATSCAFLLDTDELKKGAGESSPDPIPVENFPAALAQATCGVVERCMGAGMDIFYPEEDCATIQQAVFEDSLLGLIELSVQEGRASYSEEAAGKCIAAFEDLACEDFDNWPPACSEALEGLVPLDGDCGHDVDCGLDRYCTVSSTECPGKCKEKVGAGEACIKDDMCQSGLACFEGTCTPKPKAGEPCGEGAAPDCVLGTLCLEADNDSGTCKSVTDLFRALETQSCDFESGPLCEQGLHCAVTSGGDLECQPPSSQGGECRVAIPDQCPAGEYCDAAIGGTGVCTGLPSSNQPCRLDPYELNPPCAAYYRCVDKKCVPLRRLDEPCESSFQCYSGYCDPETDTCETLGCVF